MAKIIVELDEDLDTILTTVTKLEYHTKNLLINEAVRLLITQRLEDPIFRAKLDEHLKPLRDLIKALEL